MIRKQGDSYGIIKKKTGLTRSTIQGIIKSGQSRTLRKGKATKPKLLKLRDIERIIRWVSASWDNRPAQIKAELRLDPVYHYNS